ncbi:ABC transporter permease [Streptomyces sp. NBC_01235]|uniref:ABC transporter permease n=1 Tax=Streptomyces sp. NBC_01235 TaxID=2903788 RepID=UPI002E150A19|nr:ABC transporter permease [Streptomyces sp. NBC_01235]
MTALALPPAASKDAPGNRPGPRWLLRLHRPALYAWAGLVAVLAVALVWLWGPLTDSAAEGWRQYRLCDDSGPCQYDQDAIVRFKSVYMYTTGALTVLPFLVGAWAGASLFGRELEHGTAQLAWTQAVSPTRWLATKLAVPAVLVAAGTGLLVALHHLMWSAGVDRIDTTKTWYDNLTLHTNGPTTVAFALTGLAGGALAGVLLRRALPALMLTLGFVAAARVLADLAMPHLWPGVTKVTSLSTGPDGVGITIDSGLVTSTGAHIPDIGCASALPDGCAAAYEKLDATGYYATYHPESHYWPLQLTTTALLLAVAAALTVAAFVLLRRTTATTPRAGDTDKETAV